ncbi:beta-N-acetylglucosaminidase [Gloeobacter kilaueensis JS1]|uniref:beta-N-acetylhexosaminidase n=1 Tax=Gloeobacter kilaueensis (strain ATCC BAA-2537 / CCAP 1431/1 / ULC 316 / JS1) TaxID=1183438 RepID=U5QH94_GLOK1|nr:beta-N-acetylglucosaminidase [Gloeobacter kilaueensis JS1]
MISRRTFQVLLLANLLPGAARARNSWVEQTLAKLSLEAKIGQLMMPMLESSEQADELVRRYGVGGFIIFRTAAQPLVRQLNRLQALSRLPLLVSADFERGAGAYIDGATDLPIAMALGAANDPQLAYQAGTITALEARALGVHVIFAPVLDINNNPHNPIINVRSFGESPDLVSRLAAAYIAGIEEHGALATIKHFPGHGNVSIDTHREFGAVRGRLRELEQVELKPYRQVLAARAPHGLMAAHLWVEAIDSKPVPASLSRRVIGELLRRDLRFSGLVYTDSLGMQSVLDFAGDPGRAQRMAIEAGCDVLVTPTGRDAKGDPSPLAGVAAGMQAILQAVRRGQIRESRLDASVRRILAAKALLGLDRGAQVDPAALASIVGTPAHQRTAQQIARRALTLVQNRGGLLPLAAGQRLGVLTLTNFPGTGAFGRDSAEFAPALQPARSLAWSVQPEAAELEAARTLARDCEVLVVAAYLKVFVGDNSAGLLEAHRTALQQLLQINPRIVFISFGSPYALAALRELPVLICAYDNSKASQTAAAAALFSSAAWTGHLPVAIS